MHLEQLLQREQPVGRSNESWQRILSTAQSAVRTRVNQLDSVNDLFAFACRCLKDPDLNDAFFASFALKTCTRTQSAKSLCILAYIWKRSTQTSREILHCSKLPIASQASAPALLNRLSLLVSRPSSPCSLRASCGVIDLD